MVVMHIKLDQLHLASPDGGRYAGLVARQIDSKPFFGEPCERPILQHGLDNGLEFRLKLGIAFLND